MKRKIDNLGRIVIPSEMKKELNLKNNELADINIIGEEIVIRNVDTLSLSERLKSLIAENKDQGYIEIEVLEKILDM